MLREYIFNMLTTKKEVTVENDGYVNFLIYSYISLCTYALKHSVCTLQIYTAVTTFKNNLMFQTLFCGYIWDTSFRVGFLQIGRRLCIWAQIQQK